MRSGHPGRFVLESAVNAGSAIPGEDGREANTMQTLLDTCSAVLQDRIEMFKLELEEEKRRYARLTLFLGIAAVCAISALLLATGALVLLTPPESRWIVALFFGVFYGGLAIWLIQKARALFFRPGPPFSETLEELKNDYEWLKSLR